MSLSTTLPVYEPKTNWKLYVTEENFIDLRH